MRARGDRKKSHKTFLCHPQSTHAHHHNPIEGNTSATYEQGNDRERMRKIEMQMKNGKWKMPIFRLCELLPPWQFSATLQRITSNASLER